MFVRLGITFGYLALFVWWCSLQLIGFPTSEDIGKLAAVVGVYLLVSTLAVGVEAKSKAFHIKSSVGMLLLGVLFSSAVSIAQSYYGKNFANPGLWARDTMQNALCFFSLLGLLQLSDEEEKTSVVLPKAIILTVILLLFVLLFVPGLPNTLRDLIRLELIFLPLQYVSLVTVSAIILLRRRWSRGSVHWFGLLSVGFAFFLLASLTFYYNLLLVPAFSPGTSLFLRLVGSFLVLVSLSSIPSSYKESFFGGPPGIMYLKNVTQKVPVSLN